MSAINIHFSFLNITSTVFAVAWKFNDDREVQRVHEFETRTLWISLLYKQSHTPFNCFSVKILTVRPEQRCKIDSLQLNTYYIPENLQNQTAEDQKHSLEPNRSEVQKNKFSLNTLRKPSRRVGGSQVKFLMRYYLINISQDKKDPDFISLLKCKKYLKENGQHLQTIKCKLLYIVILTTTRS